MTMARPTNPLMRRLRRDERGAYMLELALIMPAFLMLIMGIFDIGFQMYAKSVLAGAVEQAARASTLEANNASQTAVDQEVRDAVGDVAAYATLNFSRINYRSFSNVNQPESFTDTNNNGVRNPGECYEDRNGNGNFDTSGGAAGQGGADDVVLYRVRMSFDRVFPLWQMLGEPQRNTIEVRTVLRNQPFNVQSSARVICT